MVERVKTHCVDCNFWFSAPADKAKELIYCPRCNKEASLTAVCKECQKEVMINNMALGDHVRCPSCNEHTYLLSLRTTAGGVMDISIPRRIDPMDIAAAFYDSYSDVLSGLIEQEDKDSWKEDPWIARAVGLIDEFYSKFTENNGSEIPCDAWREDETFYFFLSFMLWSASTKFELNLRNEFTARASKYSRNAQFLVTAMKEISPAEPHAYLNREKEYFLALRKSSSAVLKMLFGKSMHKPCEVFVHRACRKYIFSERALVKLISRWLFDKHVENMEYLAFT